MSRKYLKRVSEDYTTFGPFTLQFHHFFGQTRWLNGSDLVFQMGLSSIDEVEELNDSRAEIDRHISEVLFSSIVDNFQCYLSELISALFEYKPEVLSGGSIQNSIIFQHGDIDSLKKYVIDKNILDLGYKKIEDLDLYFNTKFKFSLTDSRMETLRLSRLIQIRNIIAHNRGMVSTQFIYKTGAKADKLGTKVNLPNLYAVDCYLIKLAERIDRKAIKSFKLPHFDRAELEAHA